MSTCGQCGAQFSCAMADGGDAPCWCTALPPSLPVPEARAPEGAARCWCPACLAEHIRAAAVNTGSDGAHD